MIQTTMGWLDSHLWEFVVGDRSYGVADNDDLSGGDRTHQARSLHLSELAGHGVRAFRYTYDFGDDRRHRIVVEAIRKAEPGVLYSQFLDGERRCPPEDVGSVPGYHDFLAAVAKPRSQKGKRLLDWYGAPYDPDEEQIAIALKRIANRRRSGKVGEAVR